MLKLIHASAIRKGDVTDRVLENSVVLLHRPWPEGKTEDDMLQEVIQATRSFGPLGAGVRSQLPGKISKLRQALDVYELGKPIELARKEE